MSPRAYRVALTISLVVIVMLIATIEIYIHFEGLLSIIEDAIGFFG